MAPSKRFEPSVDGDRLREIGRVTVNWAFAETMFDFHLLSLTNPDYGTTDIGFDGNFRISFKRRLEAFRRAIKAARLAGETKTSALEIASRGKTLKRARDDLNHGLWGAKRPNVVGNVTFTFQEWDRRTSPADTATLTRLADDIGELNLALIRLDLSPQVELPPLPPKSDTPASPFDIHRTHPTGKKRSGLLGPFPESDDKN